MKGSVEALALWKSTSEPETVELPSTSSTPYQLEPEQATLYRDVLAALENAKIPFAVSGAIAIQKHTAICRAIKDLDVFLAPESASQALRVLEEHSIGWEITDPVWLAKARRGDHFADLITGMSNGVITVDDSWIERAIPALVLGVNTRILGREELIASKMFVVRRERFDGADIAHLIYASKGQLDWNRILQLAGPHWEILLWALVLFRYVYPGQTYYVPKQVWDDLLTRYKREIDRSMPEARFRGSLIDDKMFAIDVEEWGFDNLLAENQARRTKIAPPVREETGK